MSSLNISSSNTTTQKLTFSENNGLNLPVTRSEVITWVVPANLGITISDIQKYSDSQDIFNPEKEPHALGGSRNWQGTISSTAANEAEETYYIKWYVNGSPNTIYTFDPKLTVSAGSK